MDKKVKYPWQQALLDAFLAPLDSLVVKVSVAEKSIAARLTDPIPTDDEERLALNDARRALSVLMREAEARRKPAKLKKEEDIA